MKNLYPVVIGSALSIAMIGHAAPSKGYAEPTQASYENSNPYPMRYEVYGAYLYLQPNGSHLYYGAEAIGLNTSIAVPAVNANWNILEVKPSYHSGFDIGARILFDYADLDMTVNWERLHASNSSSFVASSAAGYMVGPFFDIGPNAEPYKIADGQASLHYDQVNVDFGTQFNLTNRWRADVCAGAGFAYIKESLGSSYSSLDGTIVRAVSTYSKFLGAGPQLGLDFRYKICGNFAFLSDSMLSLFMGQLKNGTTYESSTPELANLGVAQPNVQTTTVPHRMQLVPGFEQRIGASYDASFDCANLTLAIGYQCQIYLDAIQTVDMTAPQVLPPAAVFSTQVGVYAVGFQRTLSNFMLTGLFVSLDLRF
jgi:hypothetical protein